MRLFFKVEGNTFVNDFLVFKISELVLVQIVVIFVKKKKTNEKRINPSSYFS